MPLEIKVIAARFMRTAILNSSLRVDDLRIYPNFDAFQITNMPSKIGTDEKQSLDENIELENLSEMYHDVFVE